MGGGAKGATPVAWNRMVERFLRLLVGFFEMPESLGGVSLRYAKHRNGNNGALIQEPQCSPVFSASFYPNPVFKFVVSRFATRM